MPTPELGLWLVADGMGGHEHGEVASALARDTLVHEINEGAPLAQAVQRADEEIIQHSSKKAEALPMGTTIAALRLRDSDYEVCWVGDSRVYMWNGELKQLSQDHSYVQELIQQGAITHEQARTHPHRNVVTQALGVTDPQSLRVETIRGTLAAGHADPAVLGRTDRGSRRQHRSPDPRAPGPFRAGMRRSSDSRRARRRRLGQRHGDPGRADR